MYADVHRSDDVTHQSQKPGWDKVVRAVGCGNVDVKDVAACVAAAPTEALVKANLNSGQFGWSITVDGVDLTAAGPVQIPLQPITCSRALMGCFVVSSTDGYIAAPPLRRQGDATQPTSGLSVLLLLTCALLMTSSHSDRPVLASQGRFAANVPIPSIGRQSRSAFHADMLPCCRVAVLPCCRADMRALLVTSPHLS